MRYRLLALDLDGTLLDPCGNLGEGAKRTVAAARERGLRVVVCTGRRFRTALPVAESLELEGPMVINNGVLVKDIRTGETRAGNYLPEELYEEVLALVREVATPLVYVDRFHERTDILTERPGQTHPYQREYLDDTREFCEWVEDLDAVRRDDVILLSTMADEDTVRELRARARERPGHRVVLHSLENKLYRGMIQEFLAPGSGKWPALARLAVRWGIQPREIIAIGDDANDVEMIRNAGLGIAMSNGVRAARSAADWVVRSNAEGGAIEAIERAILKL
jgi:Cof subfamily protein (haloacid dehalogenase superfamily)